MAKNPDGTVSLVTVSGGGWGHNLGMSQYGAHGRGKFGQSFIEILQSYYTGVDIGSYPIDIGREPGSGPATLRQEFCAPQGRPGRSRFVRPISKACAFTSMSCTT